MDGISKISRGDERIYHLLQDLNRGALEKYISDTADELTFISMASKKTRLALLWPVRKRYFTRRQRLKDDLATRRCLSARIRACELLISRLYRG